MVDEDANIIFGCVNDDEMGDELRVTVVATGLNQTSMNTTTPRIGASNPTVTGSLNIPIPAASSPTQSIDYATFDAPTVSRTSAQTANALAYDEDQLSIPTWIRRQAD